MPGSFSLPISSFNSSGDRPSNLSIVSSKLSASVLSRLMLGSCISLSKLVISSTSISAGLCISSSANLFSKIYVFPLTMTLSYLLNQIDLMWCQMDLYPLAAQVAFLLLLV
jgi:hypothetical protein